MPFWLKLLGGFLFAGVLAGYAGFSCLSSWRTSPDAVSGSGKFVLDRGQSFQSFVAELHDAGAIADPWLWVLVSRLDGTAGRLRAGEYEIVHGDTPETVMQRLLNGDVVTYQVRLLEGWTLAEARSALDQDPVLLHDLDGVGEAELLERLGLPQGPAEGWFFPDTYRFERGDGQADILRRAYARMQVVLDRYWSSRSDGLPYQEPRDALIVASLIEKETGQDADRELIAQVFVNRLRLGMRLQTDPAVIYGLGPAFDGNLTRKHLETDTPYNTYQRAGLPLSPIALPGERSIAAALRPATGALLYFVSRGDGSSEFSETLEAHNRAVRKYQLR